MAKNKVTTNINKNKFIFHEFSNCENKLCNELYSVQNEFIINEYINNEINMIKFKCEKCEKEQNIQISSSYYNEEGKCFNINFRLISPLALLKRKWFQDKYDIDLFYVIKEHLEPYMSALFYFHLQDIYHDFMIPPKQTISQYLIDANQSFNYTKEDNNKLKIVFQNKNKNNFEIKKIKKNNNIILNEQNDKEDKRTLKKNVSQNYLKTLNKRKLKKITNRIHKISKKEDIVIVINKNMYNNEEFINQISNSGFKILNGRWLFKFLLQDILEYIANKYNKKLYLLNVAILIDNLDEIILKQLPIIANKIKLLKIVTKSMYSFSYMENQLYRTNGIAIQITDNKTKSLLNTDIIINIDFNEKKLNMYKINPNATIINVNNNIAINNILFQGKVIYDYDITYNEDKFENKLNKHDFYNNVLYESYIYRKDTFDNIKRQIIKDGVKIVKLT